MLPQRFQNVWRWLTADRQQFPIDWYRSTAHNRQSVIVLDSLSLTEVSSAVLCFPVGRVGIQLVCWAVPRRADDDADQHDVTAEPAKVVDLNDPQTYQDLATPMPET